MSTTSSSRAYKDPGSGWAFGVATFAGVMLITVAVFQVLEGIAAIAEDEIYVTGIKYAYRSTSPPGAGCTSSSGSSASPPVSGCWPARPGPGSPASRWP